MSPRRHVRGYIAPTHLACQQSVTTYSPLSHTKIPVRQFCRAVPQHCCALGGFATIVPVPSFCHRALLKNPPCAATRILAQYSSRIRARAGSLSTQRQISIPVLVLRTVPVQFTHVSAYRYRSVSCTRTAVGFTGDLQIQSRASLFSARSESNPVLILPLRNRIKTYHR